MRTGGHHVEYSARAKKWLDNLALDSNFRVDLYHQHRQHQRHLPFPLSINCSVGLCPLCLAPCCHGPLPTYIEKAGEAGSVFHHASLLGEFDGYPMWQWFPTLCPGGIRWKDYIARFRRATCTLEDHTSPVSRNGVPRFLYYTKREEWYTYDRSPGGCQCSCPLDESSYLPDTTIKMGDHPVIWTNPHVKARNVYIFMGDIDPILFDAFRVTLISVTPSSGPSATHAASTPFKALLSIRPPSTDHVEFAFDPFASIVAWAAEGGNFILDTTSDWML